MQATNLPGLLEDRRLEHKKYLLQQWDQAVNRNQIDQGIEILRELDQYLTANEVAALEESARGVFRAKLHNLGVRFSLLVAEKQWTGALDVGEEIGRDIQKYVDDHPEIGFNTDSSSEETFAHIGDSLNDYLNY